MEIDNETIENIESESFIPTGFEQDSEPKVESPVKVDPVLEAFKREQSQSNLN